MPWCALTVAFRVYFRALGARGLGLRVLGGFRV